MCDLNNDMINIIKKNIPEIDIKLSEKIIQNINDVSNISGKDMNTIHHILNTYNSSYEAVDNLRKYVKNSYYKTINGERYDRSLLLLAENLIKGRGDGRISEDDMKKLVISTFDGNRITDCEKSTLKFITTEFNTTDNAKSYLQKYMM